MKEKQPQNYFCTHNKSCATSTLLLSLPAQPHELLGQFALKAQDVWLHVTILKLRNLMEKDLSESFFSRSLYNFPCSSIDSNTAVFVTWIRHKQTLNVPS